MLNNLKYWLFCVACSGFQAACADSDLHKTSTPLQFATTSSLTLKCEQKAEEKQILVRLYQNFPPLLEFDGVLVNEKLSSELHALSANEEIWPIPKQCIREEEKVTFLFDLIDVRTTDTYIEQPPKIGPFYTSIQGWNSRQLMVNFLDGTPVRWIEWPKISHIQSAENIKILRNGDEVEDVWVVDPILKEGNSLHNVLKEVWLSEKPENWGKISVGRGLD